MATENVRRYLDTVHSVALAVPSSIIEATNRLAVLDLQSPVLDMPIMHEASAQIGVSRSDAQSLAHWQIAAVVAGGNLCCCRG